MARAGATRETIEALDGLDPGMRKLAAKNKVLVGLAGRRPAAAPPLAELTDQAIAALRVAAPRHRHRKLAARAIANARIGGQPLPRTLAAALAAVGEVPDFTGSFAPRAPRDARATLTAVRVPRPLISGLAAVLPGESLVLGDSSLLYGGCEPDESGELPVLHFIEDHEEMVLEAPRYDVWLALRTGVLTSRFVGGLVEHPTYRVAMRTAAKRFGARMRLRGRRYVLQPPRNDEERGRRIRRGEGTTVPLGFVLRLLEYRCYSSTPLSSRSRATERARPCSSSLTSTSSTVIGG